MSKTLRACDVAMDSSKEEMALLGSLFLDQTQCHLASAIVSGRHFADPGLGRMLDAFYVLHDAGKPLSDWLMLKNELPKLGVGPEECSAAFLLRIMHAVPNAAHVRYYAEQIRRRSDLRELVTITTKAAARVESATAEPRDIAELAIMELGAVGLEANNLTIEFSEATKAAVASVRADREKKRTGGIFTGLYNVDARIGPLLRGELMLIAARPGKGKTVLALQAAVHNAKQGRRTLFVSLEMKDRELALRYVCEAGDVDSLHLRNNTLSEHELVQMEQASDEVSFPLRLFAPEKYTTFSEIKGVIKHAQMVHGCEAVYVDYIGRIRPTKDDRMLKRSELIGEWIIGFKSIAKELDIPVVVLAQLNRDSDKDKPHMGHLAESSDLEREADMILFLYHPEDESEKKEANIKQAIVIVGKHRHGMSGDIPVGWEPSRTRFVDDRPVESMKAYNGDLAAFNGGAY
jgi:replicative DNA helicase